MRRKVGAFANGWSCNNFGLQMRWSLHGELPSKLSCSGASLAVLACPLCIWLSLGPPADALIANAYAHCVAVFFLHLIRNEPVNKPSALHWSRHKVALNQRIRIMKLSVAHAAQAALDESSLRQHPLNLSRLSLHYKVGNNNLFRPQTEDIQSTRLRGTCPRKTTEAPPGAKVSDVQSGRHVNLFHVQF